MTKRRYFSETTWIVIAGFIWILAFHIHQLQGLNFHDSCSQDRNCSSDNLTCSVNLTCECSPNYVEDRSNPNNVICVKKSAYGEVCTSGNFNPCIDADTVCRLDVNGTNRCICDISFYRRPDNTCGSLSQLGVSLVSATSSTNSVTLTWSTNKHDRNVSYTVQSNPREGYLEANATMTGAVWVNITSGRKYSFDITSTVDAETYYPKKTFLVTKGDVWTEPAKPGPVLSISYISGAPGLEYLYNVSFQCSQGDIAYYSGVIGNEKLNGTGTVYTFRTLYPGQNCSYSITAYNGISNPSVPSIGSYRINTTDPGDVRGFAVLQDPTIALKLNISVLCPDERSFAGNILGYRIQKLLLNSDGHVETNTTYPLLASKTSCVSFYTADNVGGVFVERNYQFSVRAWNDYYVGNYTPQVTLYVAPKVPQLSQAYTASKLLQKVTNENLKTTEIEVLLCTQCLLDSSQGQVQDVGLVVCVKGTGHACTQTEVGKLDGISTWNQARNNNFSVPYRATPSDWLQTLTAQPSSLNYVFGQDTACSGLSSTVYCNGPLPTEKDLIIVLIQCNAAGCELVTYDGIFSTKGIPGTQQSNNNLALGLGIGLGVGLGCLILIGVIVGVVICKRCKKTSSPYNKTESSSVDVHLYNDLTVKPNPMPHKSVKPIGLHGYIDPIGDGEQWKTPSLAGSTHDYSTPDDVIYDYITDYSSWDERSDRL